MLANHVFIAFLALDEHSVHCRVGESSLDAGDLEKYYSI